MAASSPLSLSSIFNPKSLYLVTSHNPFSSPHTPILAFSPTQPSRRRSYNLNLQPKSWRLSAINENFWLSEANPVENSQEIVTTNEDGVSTIISALLFVAFIGLSIVTTGVIYIAVTDFLQKREREKFEKEEAAKKKKNGKKGKVIRGRARAGPRGFGQKVEEDDDDVDEAN